MLNTCILAYKHTVYRILMFWLKTIKMNIMCEFKMTTAIASVCLLNCMWSGSSAGRKSSVYDATIQPWILPVWSE